MSVCDPLEEQNIQFVPAFTAFCNLNMEILVFPTGTWKQHDAVL